MLNKKPGQYGSALFALAKKSDLIDEFHSSLQFMASLFKTSSPFRLFFYTTRVSPEEKVALLRSIVGDRVHGSIVEFVGLLSEKKEQELLQATASAYDLHYKTEMNVVSVTATTAFPLNEVENGKIYQKLELFMKKRVDMKTEVDPQLIGGIKLRIGNTFLDGSIVSQLEKMKQSLL